MTTGEAPGGASPAAAFGLPRARGRARAAADRGRRSPSRSVLARGLSYLVRGRPLLRRLATSQPALLGGLTAVAALYTVGAVTEPDWFPLATASVWILVGGFFLRLGYLLVYYVVLVAAVVVAVALRSGSPVAPGVLATLLTVAALVAVYAWDRERVGVQGALGASMLVDLRDRLRTQGTVPPLGRGWQVDTELRPAYGDSFSGDFLVAARPPRGDWVEFALVDVSGKGQPAGARALLLSGAFGGLLGAMPRAAFLAAANHYLMRQDWQEGFATAVHVAVHLVDGDVEVRSAGHPPVVHFHSGAGRWEVVRSGQGPLLGVLDEPEYPAHRARLERGDALLLYTDGLVEDRRRDIALGIDRLIGAAEQVMTRGLSGAASRIVEGTRTAGDDDRALVLIRRT